MDSGSLIAGHAMRYNYWNPWHCKLSMNVNVSVFCGEFYVTENKIFHFDKKGHSRENRNKKFTSYRY